MSTAQEFEAAYVQFLPAVSAYLSRRVERRFVEDLAADTFAIAWRKRETVTQGEELPWLYRIAANVVSNHRRKQTATSAIFHLLSEPDSAPSAEDIVLADVALAESWKKLKPRDREVLALAVLEDLPVTDIAVALEITANAASIRLHRAKKNFAELLSETERSDDPAT